jgi:RNA polymerase-binding transcription factor DksA
MRQHFHRCPNLRVLTVDAREIDASRGGRSKIVLEELCAARKLVPCVGLVECEILDPAQKRELLAVRVTRLRAEEGARHSALGDVPDPRWDELASLAEELREERGAIHEENRRLLAEAAAAADWGREQSARTSEGFASLGVSARLDESLRALRSARLDAIERGLEAFAGGDRRSCIRCQRPIEVERLRAAPDARVCEACAGDAARPELEAP